jgi:hypothetical protein
MLVRRNPGVSARSASSIHVALQFFIRIQEIFNKLPEVCSFNISQKASQNILTGFPCSFLTVTENTFEVIVLKSCLICGPMRTPALIFSALTLGNFSRRYVNAEQCISKAITKFFLSPILCVVGEATLSLVLAEVHVLHSLLQVLMIFV